jgi:hypothetical protein
MVSLIARESRPVSHHHEEHMTTVSQPTPRSDYYVYALHDPDDVNMLFPRYVGKGTGMRVLSEKDRSPRVKA